MPLTVLGHGIPGKAVTEIYFGISDFYSSRWIQPLIPHNAIVTILKEKNTLNITETCFVLHFKLVLIYYI